MRKIIFIDLETTGLDAKKEGVTEIFAKMYDVNGVNDVNGDNISNGVEIINEITNPMKKITPMVTRITGITEEMVKNKRNYKIVFNELKEICEKEFANGNEIYFVAHNSNFELNFIRETLGEEFTSRLKWIDTMYNQRKIHAIRDVMQHFKLKDCVEYFKISYEEDKTHRAGYDVEIMIEVFKKQLKFFTIKQMDLFFELEKISKKEIKEEEKDWRQEPATEKQISYIISLGGKVKKNLTKGGASKMIDRLKNGK